MRIPNLKYSFSVFKAVSFFVIIIIVAHLISPLNYSWQINTISDLGSQHYEFAWVMRIGFIGFGLFLFISILPSYLVSEGRNHSDILILLYGLCVSLSGIWSAAPFSGSESYSMTEDNLHSTFAQLAGIAFSVGILWHAIAYAEIGTKKAHIILFSLVIAFSMLVGLSKNEMIPMGMGLVQRGLYGVSFAWLIYRYNLSKSE